MSDKPDNLTTKIDYNNFSLKKITDIVKAQKNDIQGILLTKKEYKLIKKVAKGNKYLL